ncbi:hypothetical protein SAMN05216522_11744 [Rosenbergiella nectarea]|uniref:Uncharacterized protein n=1 Tax=Rosenbergiella nectarea TaxID=988801 RepID=A0A1H9MQT2_9GAMM|nr:hypothetical protein [Rosenbergiella nectarea]SER26042.1 hypothetical protein SAMN05216522_11744 [Rosenbergiella nectarea]
MWRDNDREFFAEIMPLVKSEIEDIQYEAIDLATERNNPVISGAEFEGNYS